MSAFMCFQSGINIQRRSAQGELKKFLDFFFAVQTGFLKLPLSQFNPLYTAKAVFFFTFILEEMKRRSLSQLRVAIAVKKHKCALTFSSFIYLPLEIYILSYTIKYVSLLITLIPMYLCAVHLCIYKLILLVQTLHNYFCVFVSQLGCSKSVILIVFFFEGFARASSGSALSQRAVSEAYQLIPQ